LNIGPDPKLSPLLVGLELELEPELPEVKDEPKTQRKGYCI
jgi:hypothetical protein